ncbi:polysaccharide pyruvyl transferase family protein [Roseococcus sp. YIM B11640]|uniref:polysaccharide pyruvyl transferase family protein n=1 Tax=Roseococcus sp. YIM B11640 TaxID=3133973 RepID=UPI003C7CFE0A
MRRVLVISPAGRVYEHDRVQWYDFPQERIASEYFNIGDMVVFDSTLKLLQYTQVSEMKIRDPSEADIEFYKTFDYIIVRASNFIHNYMNWERAIEVLNRVQIPVYALGVGGQATSRDDYKLTGDNLRFWQIVSERSKAVGVRGTFTADLLYANGIRNVDIVGCPSLFRARNRDLRIEAPADIKRVAFSVRREVGGGYSSNPRDYLRIQRDLLLHTMDAFDTTVTTHGEVDEKAFYFQNAQGMAKARELFLKEGWWTPETAERLERLYREKMFFFLRVEDYDRFICSQDFAFGYRVHGVLPALANGVPGVLVKYDSRSTELADSLSVPSLVIENEPPSDVGKLLREVSFDDFNKTFALRYDRMKLLIEYNGIPHRM